MTFLHACHRSSPSRSSAIHPISWHERANVQQSVGKLQHFRELFFLETSSKTTRKHRLCNLWSRTCGLQQDDWLLIYSSSISVLQNNKVVSYMLWEPLRPFWKYFSFDEGFFKACNSTSSFSGIIAHPAEYEKSNPLSQEPDLEQGLLLLLYIETYRLWQCPQHVSYFVKHEDRNGRQASRSTCYRTVYFINGPVLFLELFPKRCGVLAPHLWSLNGPAVINRRCWHWSHPQSSSTSGSSFPVPSFRYKLFAQQGQYHTILTHLALYKPSIYCRYMFCQIIYFACPV